MNKLLWWIELRRDELEQQLLIRKKEEDYAGALAIKGALHEYNNVLKVFGKEIK